MREVGESGPAPGMVLSGSRHGRAWGRELSLLDPGNWEAPVSEHPHTLA